MHHLLPISESYLYALCAGDIPFNNNNLDIKGHYIYIVQILGLKVFRIVVLGRGDFEVVELRFKNMHYFKLSQFL